MSEVRRHDRSEEIFERAQRVIPGGVNSPVRAYKAVGGNPVVISRGNGCRVWDADGNEYIDYIASWGPLILGHATDEVTLAVTEAARQGTSFGALTEREVEFAELLCGAIPCLEKVRLVNSGTEAVMSAIRLARAATGRGLVIKFEGGYHGHSDGLLAKAGSGLATFGIPGSPGVPRAFAELTITIPFNDLDALKQVLDARGGEVACLIGEPIPANMGVVPPKECFWQEVRKMLDAAGALLIFDEVITGFRLGWSGAGAMLGVKPDLCTLGKIIGGGLPVGAYGGRADLMSHISPEGPVYQAGTLSGNPLAVAAGLAALRTLERTFPWDGLERMAITLADGIDAAALHAGVPVVVNRVGSMLTVFFTGEPVTDWASAARCDTTRYAAFFRACLESGIMIAPSQFEAGFVSTAHTEEDIVHTVRLAYDAFERVKS